MVRWRERRAFVLVFAAAVAGLFLLGNGAGAQAPMEEVPGEAASLPEPEAAEPAVAAPDLAAPAAEPAAEAEPASASPPIPQAAPPMPSSSLFGEWAANIIPLEPLPDRLEQEEHEVSAGRARARGGKF